MVIRGTTGSKCYWLLSEKVNTVHWHTSGYQGLFNDAHIVQLFFRKNSKALKKINFLIRSPMIAVAIGF